MAGLIAASLAVALFAVRLVAPGPADFYIEPATGMVLIAIRPGSFMMGSPGSEPGRNDDETPHRVMIARLFYIGQYEVTQAEWMKMMGSNPSHFSSCERCPVENVDFYEVNSFLSRLNAGTSSASGSPLPRPTSTAATAMTSRAARHTTRRFPSGASRPTRGACTTCTATCGSGPTIGTARTTRDRTPILAAPRSAAHG
jgi:formylglycine-generating enzyme required for sulfatase activity